MVLSMIAAAGSLERHSRRFCDRHFEDNFNEDPFYIVGLTFRV